MQLHSPSAFALAALAAVALCAPVGAQVPDAAARSITLTATRAVGNVGAEAVHVTGLGPAARPLEVTLYLTVSRDVPTVLLSRRTISTDAAGRYDAIVPIASGFFRNSVLTVVVASVPLGLSARATVSVGPPNVQVPPDDTPASMR